MQLTIASRFQGIEGMAQGGHVAGVVASAIGSDVAVTFRSPCPLDSPLDLVEHEDGYRLLHGSRVILEAEPDVTTPVAPPPVSYAAAEAARRWAESQPMGMQVSTCFSCGDGPDAFLVHAGRVEGSDLYATPLNHPGWAAPDGPVEHRFLWAPIDCAAGWRVALGAGGRPAVTGRLKVRVHTDVAAGSPLVVVADAEPGWSGRKRRARSAIYADDGSLVASSESLWIAVA
jgi:hypothetical protein